jgi:RimJ/RimL family protein N-acetyltransferase
MARIRIARLEDAEAMREIRLEMLRLHPEAFTGDLEAEEAMSVADFAARAVGSLTFGGYVDEALAGTAVFVKPQRIKIAHTGMLGAMYVRAAHRGSGLADALVEAVIDHAIGEVEQIELAVSVENVPAIALYQRHGFAQFGCEPRSIRVGARYYDEFLMIRRLAPHP